MQAGMIPAPSRCLNRKQTATIRAQVPVSSSRSVPGVPPKAEKTTLQRKATDLHHHPRRPPAHGVRTTPSRTCVTLALSNWHLGHTTAVFVGRPGSGLPNGPGAVYKLVVA